MLEGMDVPHPSTFKLPEKDERRKEDDTVLT